MLLRAHTRRREDAEPRGRRGGRLAAVDVQGPREQLWLRSAHRRLAKNCKNLRRLRILTPVARRLVASSNRCNATEWTLESDVDLIRQQIQYLDSHHTLLLSISLGARQNAEAAAAKMLATYHDLFAQGYWPHGSEDQVRAAAMSRAFVLSTFTEELRNKDFTGVLALVQQWELHSSYHSSMAMHMERVEIMPTYIRSDGDVYVVKSVGYTSYGINMKTIEHIFPSIQSDVTLVQSLLGKIYSLPFTIIMHISSSGRIYQMESFVDTTTGLLDLIQSPMTAVKMLESSVISQGGNLQLHPGFQEGQNELEHSFL